MNLPRVEVLWKPVTAHVLEVSALSLRGFGCLALIVQIRLCFHTSGRCRSLSESDLR